jgi:endoglucanase
MVASCLWLVLRVAAQPNPPKLATSARFDLAGDAAVAELSGGTMHSGSGQVQRMNWVPDAEQPRGYTVGLDVTHFAWRAFEVRFTPRGSGIVTLTLMGPWEKSPSGPIYRQEVWWDALQATGTTLANGSFETGGLNDAAGWQNRGATFPRATEAVPAVEGQRMALTWHDQSLATALRVTAGRPVTIQMHARAALPGGYRAMRRISSRDTRAHLAARQFLRGTNLGNYLEAPPGQNWGASYAESDFEHIRAEGFDHVRLPIAWHHYTGPAPDYQLAPEIFAKADFLVNTARKHRLNVIVNIHHFDSFTSDPAAQRDKFHAIWSQLADHYASLPAAVAFELLNEPKDAATTPVLNPIYAEAIRQIRRTNPERTIFVGPSRWNQASELALLQLPDNDENLIATVHCYEPFLFTHQGAGWTGPDTRVTGIQFPGPPARPLELPVSLRVSTRVRDWIHAYNTTAGSANPSSSKAFLGPIQTAREWSAYFGRPVHMGEFGAYIGADSVSRARFYGAFRAALDDAGIGWAMWDWKAGSRYWDGQSDQPAPGMRQALFGK